MSSPCPSPLDTPLAALQNEMSFDKDASVVLNGVPRTTRTGDLGAGTPSSQRCRPLPNYFGK